MKISITVRDDEGRIFHGDTVLIAASSGDPQTEIPTLPGTPAPASRDSDFQLPVRAFMKKYAVGKNGAQKFAMLVAHMTKGDTQACVSGADIECEWNKMTAILCGAYNRAHPTRAKERGWVNSPKWGTFTLLRGWEQVVVDQTGGK